MWNFLNRIRNATQPQIGNYDKIKLSPTEIEKKSYKKFFGGGQENWELRGKFQLFFLKQMGLAPHHSLLDAGCGPIRAGAYLIDYLNAGMYCGVDYNQDFIRVAKELVAQNSSLAGKQPELMQLDDFAFSKLNRCFDYVMVFSVLNHCETEKQKLFFQELPKALNKAARVFITHATWFDPTLLSTSQLKLTNMYKSAGDVSPNLDMKKWGWPSTESIYPILEVGPS